MRRYFIPIPQTENHDQNIDISKILKVNPRHLSLEHPAFEIEYFEWVLILNV